MVLWYNKTREAKGMAPIINIGSADIDRQLSAYAATVKHFIKQINAPYIRSVLHRVAESAEKLSISCAEKCINRFVRMKAVMDSKDIPKNRGAVSFFFKHIEHHQKSTKSSISKR